MDTQRMFDGKSPHGVGDDAVAFLHRQFLKSFVFEARDLLTVVEIPHPAFEADIAAGAQGLQLPSRAADVDGAFGEAELHQPPATGGMKTTASPVASGRDQSLNSLLTATFSWSRESVKP